MKTNKITTQKRQRIWINFSSVALAFIIIGLFFWMLISPQAASAVSRSVTSTNDSGAGSLRQAIADADHGDTIEFDTSLSGQTITLASPLEISQDLTIDGSSLSTPITISGNDVVRVFYIYTDTVVTLDSLTIAHGSTTSPEPGESNPVGGGIKIESGATVTLTHCTVSNNTTTYYDSDDNEYVGDGGGIYNLGELMVIDTTFSNNTAGNSTLESDSEGGAIHNRGTLWVTDSTFSGNFAESGAGIINTYMGTLMVQKSLFLANIAACGGAGVRNVGSLATVDESIITGNSMLGTGCESSGGGIGNRFGTITVTNSTISENFGSDYGGGISNYMGTATIMNSSIFSNTAGDGGGIYNWMNAVLTVTNSSIYSNTANIGGGIYNGPDADTSLTLINSILFANTASSNGGGICNGIPGGTEVLLNMINSTVVSNTASNSGGGIYNRNSTPALANSIMWGNLAATGSQIYNYDSTKPTISFSDIQDSGGSGGWDTTLGSDGGGNVDVNPLFMDAATGDLHLQLTSPVNDAGNNNLVPADLTTDLDGAPRFMDVPTVSDTGSGTAPIVDMGVYENGPSLTLEKSVVPETDPENDVVTYTLTLSNTGNMNDSSVTLTDALPSGVDFGGWVSQPAGMTNVNDTLTWTGSLNVDEVVTAIFTATTNGSSFGEIINTAHFTSTFQTGSGSALFTLPELKLYLPLILKQ